MSLLWDLVINVEMYHHTGNWTRSRALRSNGSGCRDLIILFLLTYHSWAVGFDSGQDNVFTGLWKPAGRVIVRVERWVQASLGWMVISWSQLIAFLF